MKYNVLIILLLLLTSAMAFGQLYQESFLGLDTPAQRWSWRTDVQYFGAV